MLADSNDKFFLACEKGNTEIVGAYLKMKGNPDSRNEYRLTGLMLAGRGGHVPVAKLLIAAGANIEAEDVRGRTALFHAATLKRYDFVEFLANTGANVNPIDSHGWTPLDFSRMSSDKKMAQVLEALGGTGRYTNEKPQQATVPKSEQAPIAANGGDKIECEHKFQLVLQLPGTTTEDFDVLVNLEETVANALDGTPHEVDGHDFGSGTGNIFVHTNDPKLAFGLIKKIVNLSEYPTLKAAYRSFEEDDDDYTLIWPENSNEEFNIM